MTKRAAIYLRVSREDQTTDNQRLELERIAAARGWTITETYRDHGVSGAKFGKQRPELQRLRKDAARHRFDMLMAWSINRIGRSTHEVTGLMKELEDLGVGQFYLQQGIDSATPAGRAMIQMAVVFAEYELAMMKERINAGLRRARRNGTKSGRAIGRPKVDLKIEERIRTALAKGTGVLKVARELQVGTSVVQRIKAEQLPAA